MDKDHRAAQMDQGGYLEDIYVYGKRSRHVKESVADHEVSQ